MLDWSQKSLTPAAVEHKEKRMLILARRHGLMSRKIQMIIMAHVILLELFWYALVPSAVQAQSRDLQWTTIDRPGLTGNVVVNPSDVSEIAIGGSLFYASDVNNRVLYRSMSGGLRWEDISGYLSQAGATLPATKIAIAPDEPAIIVAATDGGTAIYLSVDGGITWGNMYMGGLGGTTVQSIAISRPYGDDNEQRDIIVGTALFGDAITSGQVMLLHLGSFIPSWTNLNLRVDPAFIGGEVSAVAFSPNYVDDQTIIAVASTNSDVAAAYQDHTYLCIGIVDISTFNANWTSNPNWPIEIPPGQSVGDSPGITIGGGLAVPNSFSAAGASGKPTLLYAFYTVDPAPAPDPSNVYQIDTTIPKVTAFTGLGTKRYGSIALSGNILLAGEVVPYDPLTVAVQISLEASSSTPMFTQTGYPYGPGNAKVAWNSNVAYCGTGKNPGAPPGPPDESGFSTSDDNGLNWVQVGLIDTTVLLQDIAVASSPQSIFAASTCNVTGVESLWRSAGEPLGYYWGRVLAIDAPSDKIIVRISPDYRDDYTLYVCEIGQALGSTYNKIWVSNERGNAWLEYSAPLGVIDLAVAARDMIYVALPQGNMSKSNNRGLFWQVAVSTDLSDISMLYMVDTDTIFVGGNNGNVAYSSDGGETYTRISEAIADNGPVQVIADTGYQQNSLVYAASGNAIYRWVIDQSHYWDIVRATNAGRQINGMVVEEDIFYALWYDTLVVGSGAERSLDISLPTDLLEWDTVQAGAAAATFDAVPTSLRYSITDTEIILWAIDSASNNIMVYFDCLAWNGPDLTMSNNAVIGCDPATGRSQEVNFTWDAICADNRYQLQIAKDDDFTMLLFDSGDIYPFLLPAEVISPALVYFAGGGTSPILAGIQSPALECGHMYYWRVRARGAVTGDIIRSPWSEVRDFTVKAGFRVTKPYYGPQLLAPDNGCGCYCAAPVCFSWSPFKETTEYKFELSENADMSSPLVSATVTTTAYQYSGQLKCNTSYFWRVMAVQPAPSDWSAVFCFKVGSEKVAASTSYSIASGLQQTPLWVWVLFGLVGVMVIVVILLIFIANREE